MTPGLRDYRTTGPRQTQLEGDGLRPLREANCEAYLAGNGRRLRFTLGLVRRLKPPPSTNVLDVGPHVLTTRLRRLYEKVDSLGINPPDEYVQPRWNEQHFEQDLSDFGSVTLPSHSYDLIVCCGVVEHITSLPREWMGFFGRMMRPDGLLVIETPNGAALKNRLMMLAGVQPYHCKERPENGDKGHIREWTKREILEAARDSGLRLVRYLCVNDIVHPGLAGRVYRWVQAVLPAGLRDDMYFVFGRADLR